MGRLLSASAALTILRVPPSSRWKPLPIALLPDEQRRKQPSGLPLSPRATPIDTVCALLPCSRLDAGPCPPSEVSGRARRASLGTSGPGRRPCARRTEASQGHL